jgi:hypothetical protein
VKKFDATISFQRSETNRKKRENCGNGVNSEHSLVLMKWIQKGIKADCNISCTPLTPFSISTVGTFVERLKLFVIFFSTVRKKC